MTVTYFMWQQMEMVLFINQKEEVNYMRGKFGIETFRQVLVHESN